MTRGQNFETMCGKDEWTAIPSAAALRAAVFALSAKNLGGGGNQPPPGVHVKGSHPVMYWHQSHQLSPFKSIAPRQVAFTYDFAEILRRLFLLWRHNFVTWPDPTKFFFHQKLRKEFPISYGKFQHDPPNGVASSSEKLMGGCINPPLTGRGLIRGFTSDFAEPRDPWANQRTPWRVSVSPRNHNRDFADALDLMWLR